MMNELFCTLLSTGKAVRSSLGAWSGGQQTINLLGKFVERNCPGYCDRRLLLSGSTGSSHQNKARRAMKPPPVGLLAILKNRFKILSLIETLGKRCLIQADPLCIPLERSGV